MRWLWNVIVGGGECNVQEGHGATTSEAIDPRNSPPDNTKAIPTDATDNRFAPSTMSKTPSTEEGNYMINETQTGNCVIKF